MMDSGLDLSFHKVERVNVEQSSYGIEVKVYTKDGVKSSMTFFKDGDNGILVTFSEDD